MQASALLLGWGSYCWARNLWVLIIYLFFLLVMLPSVVPRLATDWAVRAFPGVWKLLSFLRLPSWDGSPSLTSFVSLFIFYIFSYFLLKTMGRFSGWLMSSADIQKLFCGIFSAFKCSFDEFVGEKVVSPSYSSAILGSCLLFAIVLNWLHWVLVAVVSCRIYHWCVSSLVGVCSLWNSRSQ